MSAKAPAQPRPYGLIVLTLVMAAIVATGAPEEKSVAALVGLGAPREFAVFALYAIPVVALLVLLPLGQFIAKGRHKLVRWSIYVVAGWLIGATLGLCLELFASVSPIVAAATGPLSEPTLLDTFLWILAGFSFVMGVMLAAVAVFGKGALQAMQAEDAIDPECMEVRRSERSVFGWAGLGMVTMGLSYAALAVVRQAPEEARFWPAIIALGACVISVWPNYVLWRDFDEMQRRHVVEGYAVSAIILTLGAFVWAVIQALGLAPPMDAAGVFLALIVVQLVATSFVTASVMGQSTLFGKPA